MKDAIQRYAEAYEPNTAAGKEYKASGVLEAVVTEPEAKLRPWEKMPREVWELLQEMQDDEDTYVSMTIAVVKYLFTGEPSPDASDFKGANRVVYMSMCQNIDRYKAVSELRAKAGKRGGKHKKKTKTDLLDEEKAKTDLLENEKAKAEKASRVKSEEGRVKSEEYTDSKLSFNNNNNNNNKGDGEKNEPTYEQKKAYAISVADYWNKSIAFYKDAKLKKVIVINQARIDKLDIIRRQYSAKQIQTAIDNCMQNPYCNGTGTNEKKKPVDFDWIMRPEVFVKALENTI